MKGKKHVDERIRERALPAAGDRAFALLRDAEALARFVARQGVAGEGEVALALSEGEAPAKLIVTRAGQGVTCLAPGMATPAPVVPYDDVRAFVTEQDRLLRARMVLSRDEQKLENQRPLPRALELAYRLTRPELDALKALVPLAGDALYARCVTHVERLYALRRQTKRWPIRSDDEAAALWREHTAACLQLVALSDRPGFERLAFATLATGDAQLSVRVLWLLANRPERTLDALAELLEEEAPEVAGLGTLLGVIAARFPEERDRAAGLARRAQAEFGELALPELDRDASGPAFALLFLSMLPLLLVRYPPREARTEAGQEAFRARLEAAQEGILVEGLDLRGAAAKAGGWVERVVELLDPDRHLRQRQSVRPAPARREPAQKERGKEERVRLILWRAMLRDLRMPALALPVEVLAYLTAAPVDAVLPPDKPDPAWRLRAGREYVRKLLPEILAAG